MLKVITKTNGGDEMKKIMAIFLAVLMILMTPSFAAAVSTSQTAVVDPINTKGKGIDDATVSTFLRNNATINETYDVTGEEYADEEQIIDEDVSNAETIPLVKNTTGVVMQTTNYTCGPAALATALQNMGINANEEEIADLAETDENGTTMYGLIQAAKAKGLNAQGFKISVSNLKKNDIVFLTIDGVSHYSVVTEVNNESVKLADPKLGNIELSLDQFNEYYSGYAIVISDLNSSIEVNGTINQTNNTTYAIINQTDITSTTPLTSNILTDEEMQNLKGKGWKSFNSWCRYVWKQIREFIAEISKVIDIKYVFIQNKSGNYTNVTITGYMPVHGKMVKKTYKKNWRYKG